MKLKTNLLMGFFGCVNCACDAWSRDCNHQFIFDGEEVTKSSDFTMGAGVVVTLINGAKLILDCSHLETVVNLSESFH